MKYILGNCLRGWTGGEFKSDEEAWKVLSKMFLIAFPPAGRSVQLFKREVNTYGFEQYILCKTGHTKKNNRLKKEDVIKQCKGAYTIFGM
jgi:hypothetical protein